jgi:two-component system chemotaxis response regulator CheY
MFDAGINILVVDDMMTMRKIVINGLKKIGFSKFVEADDGATAWPLIEESVTGDKFDLIISDWNMPQLTGLELLKKVRATPGLEEVPFLMVTAEAEQKAVLEAVQEKVSNYIVKPFSPEVLKEKLELVYKKHFG